MKLIDNARLFYRFWVIRLALLQSCVISLWFVYPFPSPLADKIFKSIVFGINVLIALSRVVKQESLQPGDLQTLEKKP